MSKAIEKVAEFTPPQILLLSALGGGSAFAGMRYLTDLSHKVSPVRPHDNKIKLQLPDPNNQDMSDMSGANPLPGNSVPGISKAGDVSAPDWWVPYAAGLVGAPAGFLGVKSIYDQYQEHQGNKSIEEAKKRYTNQLMAAQQMNKIGETPLLDKLCQDTADKLEKGASMADILKQFPSTLKQLPSTLKQFPMKHPGLTATGALGGTAAAASMGHDAGRSLAYNFPSLAGIPSPAVGNSSKDIMDLLPSHDSENNVSVQQAMDKQDGESRSKLLDTFSDGLWHNGVNTWGAVAGIGGLGTLGLLLNNHHKKKEREERASYPTGVEYAK